MEFAIWLEANGVTTDKGIYDLCLMIMQHLGGYVGYNNLASKWENRLHQLASADNRPMTLGDIKKIGVIKELEKLEKLIQEDASKNGNNYDGAEMYSRLKNFTSPEHMPIQLQINEFFRDVIQVMILEKQDRVDRIYQALADIADSLDMPPLNWVKKEFDIFKQKTKSHDFWSIDHARLLELEELVANSEDVTTIKRHINHIWWYYVPEDLRVNIPTFGIEVIAAAKKLEGQ